jgi:hypothetical protein
MHDLLNRMLEIKMRILTLLFKCPRCGGKNFETYSQPETFEDYEGASCLTCNHIVSSHEVNNKNNHVTKRKLTKFNGKNCEQTYAKEFY